MSLTIDKTGNPIVVTGDTNTSLVIKTGLIYIKWIYWYQPSTAGHLLNITNKDGKVIVPAYCETGNESQWLPVYATFDGIYCDDMDSGSLYIYIR